MTNDDQKSGAKASGLLKLMKRVVSSAVLIAAFAYLAYDLAGQGEQFRSYFARASTYSDIALSVGVYSFSLVLLSVAWWALLRACSRRSLPLFVGIGIYLSSNVLKYVPSNVLHFVGRYVALRRREFSHQAITASVLLELVLISTVALALGFAYFFWLLDQVGTGYVGLALLLIFIVACVVLLLLIGKRNKPNLAVLSRVVATRKGALLVGMGGATLLYALFFASNSGIIQLLAGEGFNIDISAFLSLIGVFAAAWLAGLIVPGAPAGVGVREAALVFGLNSIAFAGDPLAIAAAYRVVTLLGDALAATLALTLQGVWRYLSTAPGDKAGGHAQVRKRGISSLRHHERTVQR